MPLSRMFSVTNMSFNAIRENKIIAKISGFTVYKYSPQNRSLTGREYQLKTFCDCFLQALRLHCSSTTPIEFS